MKDIFLTCSKILGSGEDVVMVTIIDHDGSSPRTAGSEMLVRRDGDIVGTIGGGILEATAIHVAQEVFRIG
jgi:xanthine dehydrogenase accessory factor